MKRVKVCILANNVDYETKGWIQACERRKADIEYKVVNLCGWDWWHRLTEESYDVYLVKPASLEQKYKQLYDERLDIICDCLGVCTYPSLTEVKIYENKRFLSFWLQANGLPFPKTLVFYDKKEALEYGNTLGFPLVCKTNIGASGRGVLILKDKQSLASYISKAFSSKGIKSRWLPKLSKGKLVPRIQRIMGNTDYRKVKILAYNTIRKDPQRGFVIIQEFIDHDFEWRVVRIGDSFFAHKKLKEGLMASGTLLKNYDNPPLELFDLVRNITDKHGFRSVAIDLFESPRGYLINEIQCIFGQSDDYQMKVDGVIGRYRFVSGAWIFEVGDFASNECYDLRLDFAIKRFRDELESSICL